MAVAKWNGAVLAESERFHVVEGNVYFPPETVNRAYLKESATHTTCPWKGVASYYDVVVGESVNKDAAWYYPSTSEAAQKIRGYVAFWRGVEVSPVSAVAQSRSEPVASIAADVRRGLLASPKALPPYLFYDEAGSRLYERITGLPEYYLTRTEREILERYAGDIVARAAGSEEAVLNVVELGAGSAAKTEVILRAVLRRQPRCLYVPVDVSATAVDEAEARLALDMPDVCVRPLVMTHEQALAELRSAPAPALVLFIGSSVGNFEDREASLLLRGLHDALGSGAWLLLGTDLRKSPDVLVPAYDDAAGVTAAFNKNLLVRINRELGGHFDLARFRHVARWNDEASRIEMHLESAVRQEVRIEGIGIRVHFEAGETIHTESSIKYDLPRVERLLQAAGFTREATYYDDERRFAVHLAKAR